jgi:hypothetical protein
MAVSPTAYLPFSNWSLKPIRGESARGYFLRLVANEGHYSTTVYGNEIGINGRRLDGEEALSIVLNLPIAEEYKDSLRRFSLTAEGAYFQLAGQTLRQRQVGLTSRRFCRACLAENAFHRSWWDILAFRTCPEHGRDIEDTDSAGQPIGWWWADIGTDTNGNLLGQRAASVPETRQHSLETFILERLEVIEDGSGPLLKPYPLHEVIEACEYLSLWLGNDHSTSVPPDDLKNRDVGMAALRGTWEDLVEAMRAWFTSRVPQDIRRQGKMESMGWAWNAGRNLGDTSIGQMINRAATEAFRPVGKIGKRRFVSTDEFFAKQALMPLADQLGVRIDALLPLARHLGIADGRMESWNVTETDAAVVRAALAELVPSSVVSAILGFESWDWQYLVDAGYLTAFALFGPGMRYLRSDVERLVVEAKEAATAAEADTVSVRTFARRHELPIGDVLVQVMQGRLAAAHGTSNEPGLRSVRIVAPGRRRHASRLPPDIGLTVMTVGEAATLLTLHHDVVTLLVKSGRIERADRGMLSRASVARFHQLYANAQHYRAELGCTSAGVERRLRGVGIEYERIGSVVTNIIVAREAMVRALGLDHEPHSQRDGVADLWEQLRFAAREQCPVFIMPEVVPEIGAQIRTTSRKVSLEVSLDQGTGAITLTFDMHPTLTPRRWKLLQKDESEVRADLAMMRWKPSEDGQGWRASISVMSQANVSIAARVLRAIHQKFK